jgi:hypothetical protein
MAAPFEVIASPFDCFVAPTGTVFPALDAAPAAAFKLVGSTAGARNQTDTGVTVTNAQTVGEFTPGGSTVVRKRWRQAEGLTVALAIADLSVTQYAQALDAAVTVVAPGTTQAGESHFEMFRGTQVAAYALLVRGISPFNDAFVAQYEVPSVHQMGSPAPNFSKQNPSELALEWHAYELVVGNLCVFRAQSATHT